MQQKALKYQAVNTQHAKIARLSFLMMLAGKDEEAKQQDTVTLFGLAKLITFSQGLLMIRHVLVGDLEYAKGSNMECVVAPDQSQGTRAIMQLAGMGMGSNQNNLTNLRAKSQFVAKYEVHVLVQRALVDDEQVLCALLSQLCAF